MDINTVNRADWERRRKIRLAQVRDQSKAIAKTIRDRVHGAIEIQFKQHENKRNKAEHKFKSLALSKLKSDFNYLIQDVGNGYSVASIQPDPTIVLAEKRLINRCKAISRGTEAEKRQKQLRDEQQMDKEMKDRRTHFNKTVEKIRSKLIQSIPNVESSNYIPSVSKPNECFLIPSQVTLNESNIINWNCNKKTSKPWSMTINTRENQIPKFDPTITYDNDKENEPKVSKFTKLETNAKSYETLITELNKLSAEEENIRNKLFTRNWKEVNMPHENNIQSNAEKNKCIELDGVKNYLDKSAMLNEVKSKITERRHIESTSSLSMSFSSSSSTSIKYEQPIKMVKTDRIVSFKNKINDNNIVNFKNKVNGKNTINFKNKENEKNSVKFKNKVNEKNVNFKNKVNEEHEHTVQSSSNFNYDLKSTAKMPLTNINNTLQRIKQKKQLLVKEISENMKPDIKKSNVMSLNTKTLPISKRCAAGSNLCEDSPTKYAMLSNSFNNNTLEALKELISKDKSKSNLSINVDLMKYINVLLRMTPSEVENLSTSSCSSIVVLEESVLEHSKLNINHSEILNCISKCLNSDISDISRDSTFDSPKNINLINKLQEISNYYLEKTHEMKNICDEHPQILNDRLNEPIIEADINKENNSIVISSDSSVDEEYILKHLNTLLQKKGLIKSDKEWPMFENTSDNDDTRSLTDQLLDVYPRKLCDS